MSIWGNIVKWLGGRPKPLKPVDTMTTTELKDEYSALYRKQSMGLDMSQQESFRMTTIETELKRSHVYINASGVDVYFSNY